MGTSHSAAELGAKFSTLARNLESVQKGAARSGARVIEQAVQREMRAATGGDLVLSGMTRTTGPKRSNSGGIKKIGVKVRPMRDGVLVAATGPAQLVENDVKPHIVTSRHAKGAAYTRTTKAGKTVKGRSTRESRQASALFGLGVTGGGRRAVLHWGNNFARFTRSSSKGRHPWRNGVRQSRDRAVGVMRLEEVKQIARTFK